MVDCSVLDDWEDMTQDERVDAMMEVINDALEAWGFDPVNHNETRDDSKDGELGPPLGEYDPDSDGVWFDSDFVDQANAEEALATALHEGIHAAEDQVGFSIEHSQVYFLGGALAQQLFEGCQSSADSIPLNNPDYPFQSSPELS